MKTLRQLQTKIKQHQGVSGTTSYYPKGGDEQKFMDKHEIEMTGDANGNDDEVFKGTKTKPIDREKEKHGYDAEKSMNVHEDIHERELSSAEMKKREDVVKGMKKNLGDFKKRYGADAKSVMYATATKMAKEDKDYDIQMLQLFASLDNENREFMIEMINNGLENEIMEYIKESEELDG